LDADPALALDADPALALDADPVPAMMPIRADPVRPTTLRHMSAARHNHK
jgi:hypothetical protein